MRPYVHDKGFWLAVAFKSSSAIWGPPIRPRYELLLRWGIRFDKNSLALVRCFVRLRECHREIVVSSCVFNLVDACGCWMGQR